MQNTDKFIFVRHGQTDLNAARVLQFHIDEPLNDIGREQAKMAAAALTAFDGSCLFMSSPLKRATDTAHIMHQSWHESKGVEEGNLIYSEAKLIERYGGSLEGIHHSEFKELTQKHIPESVETWDNLHLVCPRVESSKQVAERMKQAVVEGCLKAKKSSSTLVVVGHSSAFAAFARLELGFECLTKNATPYMVECVKGKWQANPIGV
tara:strand:- start:13560 stop:14180 length:621 start_codon:yes stop_codon:yes gene_type:complete